MAAARSALSIALIMCLISYCIVEPHVAVAGELWCSDLLGVVLAPLQVPTARSFPARGME
jgi:hypothetical protein